MMSLWKRLIFKILNLSLQHLRLERYLLNKSYSRSLNNLSNEKEDVQGFLELNLYSQGVLEADLQLRPFTPTSRSMIILQKCPRLMSKKTNIVVCETSTMLPPNVAD